MLTEKDISSLQRHLIAWYREHHRRLPWRETKDAYAIWISEVMLQQTTVQTVVPYYRRFLERFPDLATLAQADLQEVLKIWEGLGYYARARNLHRTASILSADHAGKIPASRKALRTLPGIGDYIAAAVASIAFNKPFPVVDGNVKRVLARLLLIAAPVNQPASRQAFETAAAELLDRQQPGTFNQAVMELGALICRPRHPQCGGCPIKVHCRAYGEGRIAAYPKRLKKPPVPHRHLVAGVVFRRGRLLITLRKPEGLLGGLWEFPGGSVDQGEDPHLACVRQIRQKVNLDIRVDGFLTRVKQAYTHFKIDMDVYRCQYVSGKIRLNGPAESRWVKIEELALFPFHKAVHRFIPLLQSNFAKVCEGR